jgi:hypothetical protein
MSATAGSPIHDRSEYRQKSGQSPDAADGAAGMIYATGLIGAAVYWIQEASTFWDGVIGVLKAFVWPGFLVYEALKALGA